MEYKGVWTLGEARDGEIKEVSFELLSRGRKLADKLDEELVSVILGDQISDQQAEELIKSGADKVLLMNAPALKDFIVENYSNVLQDLIAEYKPEIILAAATSMGRTVMPYVAIKTDAGLTADCTELDIEEDTGNLLQTRPAIGGNILATIKSPNHRPQMATVRPHSTKPAAKDESRTGEIVHLKLDSSLLDGRVKKLGFRKNEGDAVNIQDVVAAGGKGMKKGENFAMIRELAGYFEGAVGASRDAVDRDWISYPYQVGLSGKTVTPKLYFAIGISGAIQHLAGMKTSENIIAINADPDADIFKVSDFGIVGDLFEIVPELNKQLAEEVK
ncbi:electron transfer flavoprotein alpha subunit apoprotein [Halanaerobium saccharolyticum]|uniref:Electron transfer flavoprotein alpha subunit apoprotein n=1 Tax=Halanaerobium saccharolyticum TaxID=43595 RepID=A0A4R7Z119_9FIRM|nr:electron transfer flavoprotein subunit alpha/FixB family protein [Halanaerobium saccharolyticum]RAK08149.1 electron transfer flavoprotein alpha subunit apoprotein [Halanaerobium saccharolyticum]TDW04356.1 electron transfer flavoprotein alpha subunit apoprotein [Halanaerobium saccharolyticum]TDX59647.1 electron transfer flavoprotein alpha subunit apoprotein [Halanaerobium saccharolyticum]